MGIKKYLWYRKKTIDEKISYHRDQSSHGCDLYCSSYDSTPKTRKGFKLMAKHTNKAIKFERKRVNQLVNTIHHSMLNELHMVVTAFYADDGRRFNIYRASKEEK